MSIEDFLGSDDVQEAGAREKALRAERKAHEAALEQRERNSKREEPPTREEMLADLVRVAEDPELNPLGHQSRTLTRPRYRRMGHFYIRDIERVCGTFEQAKVEARLVDSRATRAWKTNRAAARRRERVAEYQETYMHPYVYDPSQRTAKDVELILSYGDSHAVYTDPFSWYAFLVACKELAPDIILANGDQLNLDEMSRYPKIPGWTVPFSLEREVVRTQFEQLRCICPDADIIWVGGNHGINRIADYLTNVATALSGLDEMRFDQLFRLDDLGVQLAQGGTIASPKDQEESLPGVMFYDWYGVYHGTSLGQTPYAQELRSAGRSGQSAHVHRGGVAYASNEALGAHSWMTVPMMAHDRVGKSYMQQRRCTGWQRGMGVAFLHAGARRVHQYPVVTSGGVAMFEGIMLEDPSPDQMPDWRRNWLEDWGPFKKLVG